jgi:hypothetical protein
MLATRDRGSLLLYILSSGASDAAQVANGLLKSKGIPATAIYRAWVDTSTEYASRSELPLAYIVSRIHKHAGNDEKRFDLKRMKISAFTSEDATECGYIALVPIRVGLLKRLLARLRFVFGLKGP